MSELQHQAQFSVYDQSNLPFCFLVASWNNILVLPECSLQTPASVILLQAVTPHLQNLCHRQELMLVCVFRESNVEQGQL